MKKFLVSSETLLQTIKVVAKLCVHTAFASKAYKLGMTESVISERSKEEFDDACECISAAQTALAALDKEIKEDYRYVDCQSNTIN